MKSLLTIDDCDCTRTNKPKVHMYGVWLQLINVIPKTFSPISHCFTQNFSHYTFDIEISTNMHNTMNKLPILTN